MNIKEKATNIEITEAIRDYLHKKLSHFDRFVDESDSNALCEVEIGKTTEHHKSGDIFRTEINLTYKGQVYRSVNQGEDLYSTIDLVKDDMTRQLQTGKDKRISLTRRGGAKIKNLIKGLFE
jgi:putative sigma-54 modulation protein